MRYRPYIAQDIGELLDKLGAMTLRAPLFKDRTGYFPQMNLESEFLGLNESLLTLRRKLGEERYAALKALSDKMRALFEADPESKTGDTKAGLKIIREMEDIVRSAAKRQGAK
jgi:hypothetical protein